MPDNEAIIEPEREERSSLGLGERLRSARTARALSVEDVAEKLHLDEMVIAALEDERFEDLGAPVFVRGHLRSYATLLELSADKLIDTYQASLPQASEFPAPPTLRDRSVTVNPVTWGFWSLVAVLALALVLYVFSGDDDSDAAADADLDSVEVPEETRPAPPPAATPAPEPATTPAPDPAAAATEQPDATLVDGESNNLRPVQLKLVFRGESWAEISDVERRLLFGLQRSGTRRELAGEPPFRLLLGNATQVDLFVDTEPYPIPRERSANDVARFIIDPPVER
jgi:cytoskeleton protein RodZ